MPKKKPKIEYPPVLEKTDFGNGHIKFLLPYILKKEEFYRRNEIIELAKQLHKGISGKDISESTERLGTRAKWFFKSSTVLTSESSQFGMYQYTGEEKIQTLEAETKNSVAHDETIIYPSRITVNAKKVLSGKEKGDSTFYVWWHRDSETAALSKNQKEWAMKVGIHQSREVARRFEDYQTAIPYTPVVGLLVHTKKAITLEKIVIATLTNRKKHINQMGVEWFETSVDEIESILKFNELI
jgi:hypothetical protein